MAILHIHGIAKFSLLSFGLTGWQFGVTGRTFGVVGRPFGVAGRPCGVASRPLGVARWPLGVASRPLGVAWPPFGVYEDKGHQCNDPISEWLSDSDTKAGVIHTNKKGLIYNVKLPQMPLLEVATCVKGTWAVQWVWNNWLLGIKSAHWAWRDCSVGLPVFRGWTGQQNTDLSGVTQSLLSPQKCNT